jgi:uncharacterized protein YggE
MSNYVQDYIVIKAKGVAETSFTSATFRASITTTGQTGPAAKAEAKTRIEQVYDVISQFTKRADIEADRVRTTFAVDVWRDRSTYTFKGYQAVYTIVFDAKNVDEVVALHDALTSINGVESPTPVFNMDTSPEIQAKVFQDAVNKAKATFNHQCKALGFDPALFEIYSWTPESEHRASGKFVSLLADDEGAVEVTPGRAFCETTYSFKYALKG